ncbi:MAG: hypothetical protein FGM15_08630 [Chthoniobacterales bacterium]|nr:hypothetical protein [Chthoniobacterales bacterium]
MHSSPGNVLVFSAEALSHLQEEELADCLGLFRDLDVNLEAIAYVRHYQSWCESFFQQAVKYGDWPTNLFPFGTGCYRFAIEKFDLLLGRDKVKLFKYDRSAFAQGCVVRDFFLQAGLGEFSGSSENYNPGLSLEAAKFLRAFHQSGIRPLSDTSGIIRNHRLAIYMRSLRGTKVRFHPELMQERMQADEADLSWIEQRLGQSVRDESHKPHLEGMIRREADLDRFSEASLAWLSRESGVALDPNGDRRGLPLEVARAMAALQDKILADPEMRKAPHVSRRVVPKIIWTFWSQGRENAPPLVQKCFDSWQEMNPTWSLRVLDAREAEPYLCRAAIPPHRLKALRIEKQSEILRMRLLSEVGGVWTDATNFCLQPLSDWLPDCMDAGLFAFRDTAPFVMVSNWFLAVSRSSRLAELWRDQLERYWASKDYLPNGSYPGEKAMELPPFQRALLQLFHQWFDRDTRSTRHWFHPAVRLLFRSYPYCVMLCLFSRGYHRDPEWKHLVDEMPYRPAKPILSPYGLVEEGKTFDEILGIGRSRNLPLMKFNWKRPPRIQQSA